MGFSFLKYVQTQADTRIFGKNEYNVLKLHFVCIIKHITGNSR